MKNKNYLLALLVMAPLFQSCSVDYKAIEKKAAMMNKYEAVSLKLAKENRELRSEIKRLEFEILKLKEDNAFYQAKLGKNNAHGEVSHGEVATNHGNAHQVEATGHNEAPKAHSDHGGEAKREIASVKAVNPTTGKDYVEFKTYKWHAEDMQRIADKEFKEKNYEKAAQFYNSIVENYPHFKGLNDEFYFKAGIAAYESGVHHDWTITHFEALMKGYPTSQYYRSAKLWVALTHMKLGDKKKFFSTVEEFRKKYRNTKEWKILSSYYEKIEEKTNE